MNPDVSESNDGGLGLPSVISEADEEETFDSNLKRQRLAEEESVEPTSKRQKVQVDPEKPTLAPETTASEHSELRERDALEYLFPNEPPREIMSCIASFLSPVSRLSTLARLSKNWKNSLGHKLVWSKSELPGPSCSGGLTRRRFKQVLNFWLKTKSVPEELNIETSKLTRQCIVDFSEFINQLRSLTLWHVSRTNTRFLIRVLQQATVLQALTLKSCYLAMFELPSMPVQKLRLEDSHTVLCKVGRQPELKELAIIQCAGAEIMELPTEHNLQALEIMLTRHDPTDQSHHPLAKQVLNLSSLTSLRTDMMDVFSLAVRRQVTARLDDTDIPLPLPNLTALEMSNGNNFRRVLPDCEIKCLRQLTQLRSLSATSNPSEGSMLAISSLPLTTLRLFGHRHGTDTHLLTDNSLAAIVNLRHLEKLLLCKCPKVTQACFRHLGTLPRLHTLELVGCTAMLLAGTTSTGQDSIAACRHITALGFRTKNTSDLPDQDARAISQLCHLERLNLAPCPSDIGMSYLCTLPKLKVLKIARKAKCPLHTPQFAQYLAMCSALEELLLPQLADLQSAREYIGQLVRLRVLRVKNAPSAEDEEYLRSKLPYLEQFRSIKPEDPAMHWVQSTVEA